MRDFIIIIILNSFVFDCIHYGLHQSHSKSHRCHHLFLNKSLQIAPKFRHSNLIGHVLMEFLSKLITCFLCLFYFSLLNVVWAVLFEMGVLIYVIYHRGEDPNHRTIKKLQRNSLRPYITSSYHALHHVYPNAYFSSHHPLFDWLFGTACPIKGRTFLVTGSRGAFGREMVLALEKKGAKVLDILPNREAWQTLDKVTFSQQLNDVDVLVLAHGSKHNETQENNVISQKWLIDSFLGGKKNKKVLPEIWGLGSELEFCSHINLKAMKSYVLSKRAYARLAQSLFADKSIMYRHIVPSAFRSSMGPGLMSAKFTVNVALFLIMRGVRYVPVTYTGLALINYFHFITRRLMFERAH